MVNFTERPAYISFSKNEIRYIFTTDRHNEAGCAVEIKIVVRNFGQQASQELVRFTVYPDSAGRIYLTIQDYLDGALMPFLPALNGQLVQAAETQQLNYWIEYRELTTAQNQTPDFTSDDFYNRVVIMGGIEEMKFRGDNFFANYFRVNQPFLTYQPDYKPVAIDQRHYLTFLSSGAPANLIARFTVYYADKTSLVKDITFNSTDNFIFHISAGVKETGLDQLLPGATIWRYDVRIIEILQPNPLMTPRTITHTKAFTFVINYTHTYKHWDFVFFNSISGLDSIRVRGEIIKSTSITFDDVETILVNRDYTTSKPAAQLGTSNRIKRDQYKGDIGWQTGPAEQEALTELLLSPGIFEEKTGRWITVINLRKSQDFASAIENKWSFPIEFSYGYTDRTFTPERLDLFDQPPAGIPPVIKPPTTTPADNPFTAFALPVIDGERIYWDAANTGTATHFKVELFKNNTWTTPNEPGELIAADITTNKNYVFTYNNILARNTTYWAIVTAFIMNGPQITISRPVQFTTAAQLTTAALPPSLWTDDNADTLEATADGEILVSENGGAFLPYTGTINVGDIDRPAGYWRFKVKATTEKSESIVTPSPAFTAAAPVPTPARTYFETPQTLYETAFYIEQRLTITGTPNATVTILCIDLVTNNQSSAALLNWQPITYHTGYPITLDGTGAASLSIYLEGQPAEQGTNGTWIAAAFELISTTSGTIDQNSSIYTIRKDF